jgi:Domain of unknown function (DUF4189)
MKKHALLFVASFIVPVSAFAIGAVAVDTSVQTTEPAYGYSIGHRTQAAAEQAALEYCQEHADNCKVIFWFKTCGAYATSKKYYGYGYGNTKAEATANALKMCARNSCEVVVAKCER